MSAETNKAVVRRYFEEVWDRGNLRVIDELVDPDFDGHPAGSSPDFGRGIEGQRQFVMTYREAFPDLHMQIEEMVADGDLVAVRWSGSGTHQGELMGMPPSGKQAHVTGMFITRVKDGKLMETWGNFDALGMLQQIGAIPTERAVGG
jgi:steroid delta-isomerase-like uncharacterized protein